MAQLLTFPPIITVRGTTNLLGSFLMPVEKEKDEVSWVFSPGSSS